MTKSCARFQPIKPGSEEHNRRLKPLDYIRTDLSVKNQSWSKQAVSDRLAELKQLVKTKTGRAMQKKATPIREAAVLLKPDTTMEDLKKLAAAYKEKFGINVFQIHMHLDEGHYNEEGEWIANLHAHVVADFIDHETGESLKLKPFQMSQLQDVTAEVLDMERGVSSNRQHLSALQFKIKAEREKLEELKKKVGPGAKLAALFKVGELADIHRQLDQAIEAAKEAIEDKAAAEKALKKAQQAEKAAKEALQEAEKAHAKELQAEKEKSRQRGISDANKIAELQKEVKLMSSKEDPLVKVNAVLTHLSMPRLTAENMKEMQATATASPFRAMSPWLRPNLCNAIMAWAFQRKRVTNGYNSHADLTLLKEMWWTMKEAWQEVCRALKEVVMSSAEIFLTTTWKGVKPTQGAALADVESVLRFTPGPSVEGWQEAVNMTEEQYDKQLQEYVQPIEQAATSLDVEQEEEHIEEEQTRQKGWHR